MNGQIESTITTEASNLDISNTHQDVVSWYVIRVTYGREYKLKLELEERNIEHFLPVKTVILRRTPDGKLISRKTSAIPNTIFIRETRENIQQLKTELEGRFPMRYMMNRNTHQPLTVREKQMQDFIRFASLENERLLYLNNPDVVYEKGQPVEIVSGPFAGVHGYILRIRRDRKLVISVDGVLAAAVQIDLRSEWIRKL